MPPTLDGVEDHSGDEALHSFTSADQPVVHKPWYKKAKDFVVGDYDFITLCMPQWPFCRGGKERPPTTFFAKEEKLPLLISILMGAQHFLAMCVGLITPPLLVSNMATGNTENAAGIKQYMISASLIVAGIATLIQVYSIPIWPKKGIRLGSGILSTMGITIVFVSICQGSMKAMMTEDGMTFEQAFGAMAGTIALVSPIPMLISFVPPRVLHRVFSETVIGVVVILIGVKLVGVGFEYWGGGASCSKSATALCISNGGVKLPFGSPEYVGLGFSVFATIVVIELFGSPFLRNASIMVGLIVGYIIAAVCTVDGQSYISTQAFSTAPWVTFLWTTTFPLSIYPPAIIPCIIGVIITSVETVGDVAATEEASNIPTEGPEHNTHVRGGLLNDGAMTLLAGLSGVLPVTTFAQNNGIIAITRCASRSAGYAAAAWLLLAGILGKFAAFILSIPHCVLGGATAFLFANVAVSGIKIMIADPITRRNRFIAGAMMTFGLGVALMPQWATNALWPRTPDMSSLVKSLNQAVMLIMSTGFVFGCVVGVILNLLIPAETDVDMLKQEYVRAKERLDKVVGDIKASGKYAAVMADVADTSGKGKDVDGWDEEQALTSEDGTAHGGPLGGLLGKSKSSYMQAPDSEQANR